MKRTKKLLAGMLVLAMVLSQATTSIFAGVLDEMKNGANAMALVMVDNEDCEKLPEVGDLTVRISSAEAGIDIKVPVKKVSEEDEVLCMWLGEPEERISDEIMKKLAEIQGKIDLQDIGETLEDVEQLLNKFQVEVQGLPEGHYVSQGGALVITNEIFKQAMDIIHQAFKEQGIEFNSFSELIEKALSEEGMTLDDLFDMSDLTEEEKAEMAEAGITEEDIALLKDLLVNIDQVIDYLCSDAFTGVLIAGANLTCSCPRYEKYQIQHRYYERTGGKLKLIGTVHEGDYDELFEEYYLTGKVGDVIEASDYQKNEYKGKTYEFMGSYDNLALIDGWKGYEMESFVLGEDLTTGLVLRYVIDKGGSPAAGSGTGTDGNGQEEPAREPAPKTGDEAPLGMYLLLLITAAGAALAMRKQH